MSAQGAAERRASGRLLLRRLTALVDAEGCWPTLLAALAAGGPVVDQPSSSAQPSVPLQVDGQQALRPAGAQLSRQAGGRVLRALQSSGAL